MAKKVSVSLISHGQFSLVMHVLDDLNTHCADDIAEVILTINVDEDVSFSPEKLIFSVHILRNPSPKGFGANHNAAFRLAKGDFFCVLNPDIRLRGNPFPTLLELAGHGDVGVVAPAIIASDGSSEDSARMFPAPSELLRKAFGGKSAVHDGGGPVQEPDWIAGMFMLFPRSVFEEMGGFDERYFLYYEDVDLCARLALKGYRRLVCTDVQAVHDARRTSRRNLRYALMHLKSIFRFFSSDVYLQLHRKARQPVMR